MYINDEELPVYGTSQCGHSERFGDWEDHSKPLGCLKCKLEKVEALLREAMDEIVYLKQEECCE